MLSILTAVEEVRVFVLCAEIATIMRLENFEKIIVIPKKEQRDLLVIYRRQLLGKLGVKGQAYSSKIRDALKVYDQLDEQVRLERSLPFF